MRPKVQWRVEASHRDEQMGEEGGRRIDIVFGSIILEDWSTIIDDSATPLKVDYKILWEGSLTETYEEKESNL